MLPFAPVLLTLSPALLKNTDRLTGPLVTVCVANSGDSPKAADERKDEDAALEAANAAAAAEALDTAGVVAADADDADDDDDDGKRMAKMSLSERVTGAASVICAG